MNRRIGWLCILLLMTALFLLSFFWLRFLKTPLVNGQQSYLLTIEEGRTAFSLVDELNHHRRLNHPWFFKQLLRFSSKSTLFQAGVYLIEPSVRPVAFLEKLSKGAVLRDNFTIVPGIRLNQLLSSLKASPYIKTSQKPLNKAGFKTHKAMLEGRFLAETYRYKAGSSDFAILVRSNASLEKALAEVWNKRDKTLPLQSPTELLIVASIIEKETGIDSERPLISAVVANRLKQNMLLQMDPTVIYGLGDNYRGKLFKDDLKSDSPYNTYRYRGLPPTPIALVSKATMVAAAHPAAVDYLYFVAAGDGSHVFSTTLEAHNQAVQRYYQSIPNSKHS